MYCQQCGKSLSEDDLDRETLIASCQNCYGISDFSNIPDIAAGMTMAKKSPVPLPSGIKIEQAGRNLIIKSSWFGGCTSIFLLVFAILWDTGLIVGLSGAPVSSVLPVFMFHGAAGVVVTYIALTMLLNQTVFEVNDVSLSVNHKPLPWPGNQNIFSSDVSQLYCKKDHTRRKNKRATFCLNAKMKDGSERTLLSWLESPEQALYIEQEIEKFLKIEDRPVQGELKK